MKRLAVGILAHVDSGKTTLSESLLYNSGEITRLGRVDHRDAFLDNHSIERDRGITIFSKQAMINLNDTVISLLDTPGHVDFSAETERTLSILDYAILVVSATDGVQGHTKTLWEMLKYYNVPTFIFINKTDLDGMGKEVLTENIRKNLDGACVDFSEKNEEFYERLALNDELLLEEYTSSGGLSEEAVADAIFYRKIFPCYFGSALKNDGVSEFLNDFVRYTKQKKCAEEFGARVFKISEDDKGQRLTHMKITSGALRVRTQLTIGGKAQKVNEIRIYSGKKYKSVNEVFAGDVCAVTGISGAEPTEGLGIETGSAELMTEPVFSYTLKLPPEVDEYTALGILRRLEHEETKLKIGWNEYTQKISVRLMGEIQLEVLKRILEERFGLSVEFESGNIIYKETIKNPVVGVGHYEPLKHYAEVHLLLEPGEPGSGLVFKSRCSEDILDKSWQRLILTHLNEKKHIGALCGMQITDMIVTLINGRAHQKHTEGGDFRQATYRALRQGLRQAESVLLEPWYDFELILPTENIGRAMTDLQQMGAEFEPPEALDGASKISGSVPVRELGDYRKSITQYTHGRGRMTCTQGGYRPCKNQNKVAEKIGYDCDADTENTADSVFCSHGSGFLVKWNEVFDYAHCEVMKLNAEELAAERSVKAPVRGIADEEELLRIFERTYGKVKRKSEGMIRTQREAPEYKVKPIKILPQYLLIDGYNIIFAWDELKALANESLNDARLLLISRIANYRAMKNINVILVFDAYRVGGNEREIEDIHGVKVVYTREAETADSYIEKTSERLIKNYRVRVATSDSLVQMIIFGSGAERISAREFISEIETAEEEMQRLISEGF